MTARGTESVIEMFFFFQDFSIPALLFGTAALMGNRSSNKTADCTSLQTVAPSTQTCSHVYQAPAVDPAPLHFTYGR